MSERKLSGVVVCAETAATIVKRVAFFISLVGKVPLEVARSLQKFAKGDQQIHQKHGVSYDRFGGSSDQRND